MRMCKDFLRVRRHHFSLTYTNMTALHEISFSTAVETIGIKRCSIARSRENN